MAGGNESLGVIENGGVPPQAVLGVRSSGSYSSSFSSSYSEGSLSRMRTSHNGRDGARPSTKNHIFMRVPHDLFKLTTADENVPDSPFEGG